MICFAVMIYVYEGSRFVGDGWERVRRGPITWTVEASLEAAEATRRDLLAGRSRQLGGAWVERRVS